MGGIRSNVRGAVPGWLALVAFILAVVIILVVIFFAQAFALAMILIVGGILMAVLVPPDLGPVLGVIVIIIGAVLFITAQGQQLSLSIFGGASVLFPAALIVRSGVRN